MEKYDRLCAEWLANGRLRPPGEGERQEGKVNPGGGTDGVSAAPTELTVLEVIAAYIAYAEKYYLKNGKPTSELDCIKGSLRELRQLYGRIPAAHLTPKKLKTVRERMIARGLARTTINKQVNRIKRFYRWAAEEELVSGDISHALDAVKGLRKGRGGAHEAPPVLPVSDDHIAAVRPHVSPTIWAAIQVQRYSGMRSGELLAMRPCDVDRSGPDVWYYSPSSHKTEACGSIRIVVLGPKAQAVLLPLLERTAPFKYLFDAHESEMERNMVRRDERRSPMTPSQARRNSRPKQYNGNACYRQDSYRIAIRRACEEAGIPVWHPHRLRHTYGTITRKIFGAEAARAGLGHKHLKTTEIYAEVNTELAAHVARETG